MKRLLFSTALALAVHGLIFGFNGEWLKKRTYHPVRSSPVTISLTSLQLPDTRPDSELLREIKKKKDDIPENKFRDTKRIPERPAVITDMKSDTALNDTSPATGESEANVLKDSLPSSIPDKRYADGNPKNGSDLKQAYDRAAGETQPVSQIIKEAVPLYKENPAPVYPLQAKKRGHEGTVILEVLVTKEGNAGKVSVFRSSRNTLLDEAAVSSVKKWRFEPGRRGDMKVDMTVKIPIRFQLETD